MCCFVITLCWSKRLKILKKLNSNKIGITKDKRDYDAAIMLIKFFIRNRKINLLYSNYSINSLKNKLGKHNVNVSKYINIDVYKLYMIDSHPTNWNEYFKSCKYKKYMPYCFFLKDT